MKVESRTLWRAALIAATVAAAAVSAQETPSTFEFSFSNPGARSLGLAGAFAALADDATAAFANPAGLVQLVAPEASVEIRHWRFSTPFTAGGRFEGSPTGIGLDTTAGLRTAESRVHLTGPSFLSFVYPQGRSSLAVYRHQMANFRARTDTQGLFHQGGTQSVTFRSFDRRWFTDLDILSYGVAGAYRITDAFSVGVGVVYFDGGLQAPFAWYFPDDDTLQGIFGPNSYHPERQVANGNMSFDDSDWGLNAGLLWSFDESWSLGAFYRRGPEFDLVYDVRAGPALNLLIPSISTGDTYLTVATPMKFPDVSGLGVAYRSPDGRLSLGLELDRVEYSSIFESFDPTVVATLEDDLDLGIHLRADDGNEIHLGAEYALLHLQPVLALRAGVWLDPDHRFRSISDDPEHRLLFRPGEDEVHIALGVGLAFDSFQVDLAADFSDPVDTASLSVIYAFQ